jgi:hypothetical protein
MKVTVSDLPSDGGVYEVGEGTVVRFESGMPNRFRVDIPLRGHTLQVRARQIQHQGTWYVQRIY